MDAPRRCVPAVETSQTVALLPWEETDSRKVTSAPRTAASAIPSPSSTHDSFSEFGLPAAFRPTTDCFRACRRGRTDEAIQPRAPNEALAEHPPASAPFLRAAIRAQYSVEKELSQKAVRNVLRLKRQDVRGCTAIGRVRPQIENAAQGIFSAARATRSSVLVAAVARRQAESGGAGIEACRTPGTPGAGLVPCGAEPSRSAPCTTPFRSRVLLAEGAVSLTAGGAWFRRCPVSHRGRPPGA